MDPLSLKTEDELKALRVEAVQKGDWLGFCAVVEHGRTPLSFGFIDEVAERLVLGDRDFLSALLDYCLVLDWRTKVGYEKVEGLIDVAFACLQKPNAPELERHIWSNIKVGACKSRAIGVCTNRELPSCFGSGRGN